MSKPRPEASPGPEDAACVQVGAQVRAPNVANNTALKNFNDYLMSTVTLTFVPPNYNSASYVNNNSNDSFISPSQSI